MENLCDECLLLGKEANFDFSKFKSNLKESPRLRYIFEKPHLSENFVKNVNQCLSDKPRAAKRLYERLTFWLDEKRYFDTDLAELDREERAFAQNVREAKREYFEKYFSLLSSVNAGENSQNSAPLYAAYDEKLLKNIRTVLWLTVGGDLKKGRNILFILCSIPDYGNLRDTIDVQSCPPHFRKLMQRRGKDFFLRNDDVYSRDFVLALFEAMPFQLNSHKCEFLGRLETLLNTI